MPRPDEPAEETSKLSLFYRRHEVTITRAEVIIVFLALIRTITVYYQLKPRPGNILPAGHVGRAYRAAQRGCAGAWRAAVRVLRAGVDRGLAGPEPEWVPGREP